MGTSLSLLYPLCLLTFIPFTLLSIFILGHVIDLSNPGLPP